MSNIGNKETMAKNLSYYVGKSGKTQKELAAMLGVAPSTFNDWTKGKKYPRIDKIEALANCFGILKSDLIEEKSEEHKKMQETNNTLVNIVVRLRSDPKFFSLVDTLNELDDEKLSSIEHMLAAFK